VRSPPSPGLAVAYGLVVAGAKPVIDVWPILQGAARGLVDGRNPYDMVFAGVPAGQVNNCFNYLPGTFLVPLPGRLLFGDVRYAEAAVLLAGVAALVWLAARSGRPGAVPLALLAGTLPGSLYDVQQAWNETIVFGALGRGRGAARGAPAVVGGGLLRGRAVHQAARRAAAAAVGAVAGVRACAGRSAPPPGPPR
jgi:hypothetical protein